MRAIQFNDLALEAMHVPYQPLVGGLTLNDEMRSTLDMGLFVYEGALIFTAHRGTWPAAPPNVQDALKRMGWRDLTMYECQYNSLHLEDYAAVTVGVTNDNVHQISEADQVGLLRLGLLVADDVIAQVRQLQSPVPVRCIIVANRTNGTFRFHQIRQGESWLNDDLDAYREDKIVVVDDFIQ